MTTAGGRGPGPNLYDVLDVDPAATHEEIQAAWRSAIADLTPADRRFRLYNQAAEVLLDPERRAAHDAEQAAADESAPAATSTAPVAAASAPAPTTTDGDATTRRRWRRTPPATPATTATSDGPGRGVRWLVPAWLLAVVGVLAVLALGATAWLWTQPSAASVEDATTGARNAAERAAVTVLSYDYETLEEDQAAAHGVMTSDYRKDYDKLFALIEENAPETETKVGVDVVASSIVRAGPDRVSVLLFLDRPTTNKATEEPVVYKDQATLTMQRVDGEWLVDEVSTSPVQP